MRPEINSLLKHPICTCEFDGEVTTLSIPQLLVTLLLRDAVDVRFPRIRAEQRSHWWRFLVRTAAHVLHETDRAVETLDDTAEDLEGVIRQQLITSTDGEEAWLLYHRDSPKPAFLQAPTPGGEPPEESYKENTLSFLTTAIGSKNFERKIDVFRECDPEQAMYALIEFQMGAIFGGRGNYGSQLMGSGSGKGSGTPFMGVRLPAGDCETFRYDVGVLLSSWDELRKEVPLDGEVWALWTEPWDGATPLPTRELTPAFIPMARMVRLAPPKSSGRFSTVYFKPSQDYRVQDHTEGGTLGDPFTPLVRSSTEHFKVRGAVALDPERSAYDYREVASFFVDDDRRFSPAVAALIGTRLGQHDRVTLILEGVAFDQGKTLGFHRRTLPLPLLPVRMALESPDSLRKAHEFMLQRVRDAQGAVRGAARILLHGEPRARQGDNDKVDKVSAILNRIVDGRYLTHLFDAAEQEAAERSDHQKAWVAKLSEWAIQAFKEGEPALPSPNARRYERLVLPEAYLRRKLRRMREEVGVTDGWSPKEPDEDQPPEMEVAHGN